MFLGAIGLFMKGSRIDKVLYMSCVYTKITINKDINCKDYYNMMRYHAPVNEVMTRLI